MQFWQSLAQTEPVQLLEVAQMAEQAGFTGVCISDHLVRPIDIKSAYPYATDGKPPTCPETPFLDPWVLMTAIAMSTTSLKFMPYVYVLPAREPFSVAKSLSSLALVSNNRVLFAVGVGWMEDEFDLTGQNFRNRGKRTDEMLLVIDKLLETHPVEHHGEFYDFAPLQMSPAPEEKPLVLVGGQSSAAYRRAAGNGGWMGVNYDFDQVPGIIESLNQARTEAGTLGLPFEISLGLNCQPTIAQLQQLESMGVTMYLNPPLVMGGSQSSIEDKRQQLVEFSDAFIKPMQSM
jgi:probable F420-dependent oxidoreductase